MADLIELQFKSHDGVNCKVVKLRIIFVTIQCLAKNGVRMEKIASF